MAPILHYLLQQIENYSKPYFKKIKLKNNSDTTISHYNITRQVEYHGRLKVAHWGRRLIHIVQSIGRATEAQIAEKVNAGSDRKLSEHTMYNSLLYMGVHSLRPLRVPMLTSVSTLGMRELELDHEGNIHVNVTFTCDTL